MKRKITLLVVVLTLSASPWVHADLLATYTYATEGWQSGIFDTVDFSLSSSPTMMQEEVDTWLWWNNITSQHIGSTFHITEQMNPDFAIVANRLTNGSAEMFEYGVNFPDLFGGGSRTGNADFLLTDDDTDLIGNELTSISLTVNELVLAGHDYTCNVTYSFWGKPIPEPATLLLLGMGGLTLRVRRHK